MDPERYERLMDMFDDACDRPLDVQRGIVAHLRSHDVEMADRLAKLLKHDATGTDVLGRAAGQKVLAGEMKAAGILERLGQTPSEGPSRVGTAIGAYVVGDKLGSGGLGTVHVARHRDTGHTVAIKFLKPHATADEESVIRLRREFRAISTLDHPGCLRVFEHNETPQGHYIVMEHVRGGDLRRLVGGDRPLILAVLHDVAKALSYVHARGVVHRDLKPANVLLTEDDPPHPKLADFGIAKMADASAIITGSQAVLGSIDFMSPEQLRGRADARSDMYAFGCMIHHLWCGQPPFTGDNFERLYRRLNGEAPSLRERDPAAPGALIEITDRLLARDPDHRPGDCSEIAEALVTAVLGD
jgi:serine/threonine-protein kinase